MEQSIHDHTFAMYGDFGKFAELYDKYRFPYHESIFRDIFSSNYFTPANGQTEFRFLDVGCGTGHSTFALAHAAKLHLPSGSKFSIIGIDIDSQMIHVAKKKPHDSHINFYTGDLCEETHIGRNFDMIICASAFHWISKNPAMIKKMYSLLKASFVDGKTGKFPLVILNRDIRLNVSIKQYLRERVAHSTGCTVQELPNVHKEYFPNNILYQSNFSKISSIGSHIIKNPTTPEEFGNYIKTTSIWNCIPNEKKEEEFAKILELLECNAKNRKMEREDWYSIHFGYRYNR